MLLLFSRLLFNIMIMYTQLFVLQAIRLSKEEERKTYRLYWNQREPKWAALGVTAAAMRSGSLLHLPRPPKSTMSGNPFRKLDASVRIVVGYRPWLLPTRTPSKFQHLVIFVWILNK